MDDFYKPNISSYKGNHKMSYKVFLLINVTSNDSFKIINRVKELVISKLKQAQEEIEDLQIEIAIMSIGNSIKWICNPTKIGDLKINNIDPEVGKADLRKAISELNQKLSRTFFMQHDGKIRIPLIVLITDNNIEWNCDEELNDLQSNGWFRYAERKVFLIGENLNNEYSFQHLCPFTCREAIFFEIAQLSELLDEKIDVLLKEYNKRMRQKFGGNNMHKHIDNNEGETTKEEDLMFEINGGFDIENLGFGLFDDEEWI